MSKKIRILVFSAFLVALEIVLNRFCSFNTLGLKIGFSFIPGVIAAMLFGPIAAAAVNGVGDFLGAILFPIGPYHPGFTVCAALMGLVSGLFLYRKPLSGERRLRFFANVLPPVLINNLIFGLCINTIWITMLYGSKTYGALFLSRLSTEYAILIPMQLILIPLLSRMERPLSRIINKQNMKYSKVKK